MKSVLQERNQVDFPKFNGDRIYMLEFFKGKPLPVEAKRWQLTVDQMMEGVDAEGPLYLMVDQAFVKARNFHRRPGVHIDGYWQPMIAGHSGGDRTRGGDRTGGGRHSGGLRGVVAACHGGDRGSRSATGTGWNFEGADPREDWEPESLLLASNIEACRTYVGEYFDFPKEGGDCAHIDTTGMTEIILKPNVVYAANVTCLHETLPVAFDCNRTVVRINVPNWRV